jgi:hypothetical protein
MEDRPDSFLFEDIATGLDGLDQGMTFHQESCDVCMRNNESWRACMEWLDLVEQWNFLTIAMTRHLKDVERNDAS